MTAIHLHSSPPAYEPPQKSKGNPPPKILQIVRLVILGIFCSLLLNLNSPIAAQAGGFCQVGPPSGGDDTGLIQAAIDACASEGGGEVRLQAGQTYVSRTLALKSDITLNLNGATIRAADSGFRSLKCPGCHKMFIGTAAGAVNVSIVGPGLIEKPASSDTHVAMVEFWDSSNISVRDLTIDSRAAPVTANGFHLVTSASDHVTFENITIRGGRHSGQSWGNDGMDLQSSQHVVVRNCDIDTHDDGIAIASSSGSGEVVDDILVEDCRVASDSTTLKFGTGSEYDFTNITFQNITLASKGIRFSIIDGGAVSNVLFSGITVEPNVTAVFSCGGGSKELGDLKDCVGQRTASSPRGSIQDVTFENFEIYGGGGQKWVHGEASLNNMDRVRFENIHYWEGSGSAPLTWFRDICGLSISVFQSHLSGDPEKDLRIDSSVTNLAFDGSPPQCGGIGPTPQPTPTPTPEPDPIFADVPADHWAHEYIETLYQLGYVSGCSTDPLKYCPDQPMNRAESAVFVERGIHKSDYLPEQPSEQIFADVALDPWFAKWATGLWNDGYTSGCGTDPLVYCPHQEHTRTEGTVFFLRMRNGTQYVPPEPEGIFIDVPIDFWGAKWIEAAYRAGLIPPCQTEPELRFCPDDPLDRALGAYMMVQAKELPLE